MSPVCGIFLVVLTDHPVVSIDIVLLLQNLMLPTVSLYIARTNEIMVITRRTFHCFYIFSSRVLLTLGRRQSFIGGERNLLNCPAADQQDSSTVYGGQCVV